jgi:hypothetical protein
LVELSLCKQQEKETLREYYRKFLTLKSQLPSVDDQIAIYYAISGLRADVLYSHCIRDPPKNLQELYQLFEKYARSEELHQRKVESQRKPKDPPQSSRTCTRPSQSDSGRDNRSQQQVHSIAIQHPAGEASRRQDYPPRATQWHAWPRPGTGAAAMQIFLSVSRRRLRAPNEGLPGNEALGTRCLEHNPPITKELSHTHINTTSHNHTTTASPNTYPTTHINTTRRYKSYHPHSCLRINQTYTTKITPSTKTRRLRRSAVSWSHSHDHRRV